MDPPRVDSLSTTWLAAKHHSQQSRTIPYSPQDVETHISERRTRRGCLPAETVNHKEGGKPMKGGQAVGNSRKNLIPLTTWRKNGTGKGYGHQSHNGPKNNNDNHEHSP